MTNNIYRLKPIEIFDQQNSVLLCPQHEYWLITDKWYLWSEPSILCFYNIYFRVLCRITASVTLWSWWLINKSIIWSIAHCHLWRLTDADVMWRMTMIPQTTGEVTSCFMPWLHWGWPELQSLPWQPRPPPGSSLWFRSAWRDGERERQEVMSHHVSRWSNRLSEIKLFNYSLITWLQYGSRLGPCVKNLF